MYLQDGGYCLAVLVAQKCKPNMPIPVQCVLAVGILVGLAVSAAGANHHRRLDAAFLHNSNTVWRSSSHVSRRFHCHKSIFTGWKKKMKRILYSNVIFSNMSQIRG